MAKWNDDFTGSITHFKHVNRVKTGDVMTPTEIEALQKFAYTLDIPIFSLEIKKKVIKKDEITSYTIIVEKGEKL